MVCCKDYGIIKAIVNKALSQKKVTKVDNLEESIRTIFGVIDYINAQDEFLCMLWDNHLLEDVNILNEFKDFILPSAVRFDALNRRTKDLLVKPILDVDKLPCSYSEYVEACDKFRSCFKKDGYSDVTDLASLRKAVNFNDVVTRASINGEVCAQGKPFIPIPLKSVDLFEARYFNEKVEDIISDYISEMRFI